MLLLYFRARAHPIPSAGTTVANKRFACSGRADRADRGRCGAEVKEEQAAAAQRPPLAGDMERSSAPWRHDLAPALQGAGSATKVKPTFALGAEALLAALQRDAVGAAGAVSE